MFRRACVAVLLSIAACSSFESNPSAPTNDAGIDAPADGAPDAAPDVTTDSSSLSCEPGMLARTLNTPTRLGTDGIRIYWLEPEQRVMRASVTDTYCMATTIAEGEITAFAVDSNYVVWADPKYHSLPTTDLTATPADGTTSLHPSVVLNAGSAFWINGGKISTCTLPCTAGTTYASSDVSGASLLASGGGIRVFHFGTVQPADGVALWWNIAANPEGTSQGPLATQQNPRFLTATPLNAIWVNGTSDQAQLLSIPQSGAPSINVIGNVARVTAIAAEEPSIYVAFDKEIRRYSTTNPSNGDVIAKTDVVSAMVVLGNELFYAQEDKTIRRVPR